MKPMKTFPTLYKKSSGGALQQWTIYVEEKMDGGLIRTEHGQVGGKIQEGTDLVTKGKNPGKKNATTPYEQACKDAQSKWNKKKEGEGYVEELARAEAGEDDAAGGIAPMLAQTYDDDLSDEHKVYPAHGQRKLNGLRCLTVIKDGKVSLWSRKRKPILGVPHVVAAYEKRFATVVGEFIIDGELYRHGWSLQKISGYCRKEKTKPGFEQISHNVYDTPVYADDGLETPWEERQKNLDHLFTHFVGDQPEIKKVETIVLRDEPHMRQVEDGFVDEHFEGLIYRNLKTPYESDTRSYGLLKVKRWKDAEFPILAVFEGRGKFAGKAIFTCETVVGRDPEAPKQFDVCAPGNFEDRENFLKDAANVIGKHVTVKYFEWTDEKKPQHPVGMAVRDYE